MRAFTFSRSNSRRFYELLFASLIFSQQLILAQVADLWTPQRLQQIRDQSTLSSNVAVRAGYFEVRFNSEIGTANWADTSAPYALHTNDSIRIHGYLATPLLGGPYPAIVVGHGHGGHGSPELAAVVASLGYVALSIDGPMSGGSTGGPQDTEQAWLSVEPSPDYSYLYHYAYAGMRALTLLESLSNLPGNPYRIDRTRLGVLGASMGGQFTQYINGVDDRVKAAVSIVAAGDWQRLLFYPGAWLYHGLFYYTRDGLANGVDAPNAVANVCTDATLDTFLRYFDPISYAPTQHGPLLMIIGTHDQYFTAPAINTTYERVASSGLNPRFQKRMLLTANAKHGLIDQSDLLQSILPLLETIRGWLRYAFNDGQGPAQTPKVTLQISGTQMNFTAEVAAGESPIQNVRLYYASQINTVPAQPNDFASIALTRASSGIYTGSIPLGQMPPAGPAISAENILYYVEVQDDAGVRITSELNYKDTVMGFCSGFTPTIEHYPRDSFAVVPPPSPNCSCRPRINAGGIVNNASFAPSPAPVAPGSIAAIFGTSLNNGRTLLSSAFGPDGKLVSTLAGTTVTINNIPAPIFYSTPTQIGVQIPAELTGTATATVTIGGQASEPVNFSLSDTAPGIFTRAQDGRGTAALLHQDGLRSVSFADPARPGEILSLFATGLGSVVPPLATGAAAQDNRTSATPGIFVDGSPAELLYSGTAPGFVGLNQINFRIPANAREALDIPVIVSIGGRMSNQVIVPISR